MLCEKVLGKLSDEKFKNLNVDYVTVIAVNIPPCDVIVAKVAENHPHIVPKVCYEIGNRHATLFYGDTPFEYITPFNQPMLDMLNKIHGVTATVVNMKLNFDKSISSTINNHTH